MATVMKYRVRLVFISLLALASLATLLLMGKVNSVLKIPWPVSERNIIGTRVPFAKTETNEPKYAKTEATGPKLATTISTCNGCESTNANNSTADIRTLYIYDDFNFTDNYGKYVVQFPKESESAAVKSSIPEKLTVLLIPHSHNDPGWLQTVDGYYDRFTRHIFDSMIAKLKEYPQMTMVWAETVYLSRWFEAASAADKNTFRQLVDNGQIDVVTGGWVMPDEASTHYYSIIDQLIEGHQWLLKNLKVKPRINWSIDPFGHSGTVPYLWRLAGFNGMVVQRVHQAIKDYLGHYQKLEFRWRQTWDKEGKHDIFCHMMPYLSYDTSATCGPDQEVCVQFKYYGREALNTGEPGSPGYKDAIDKPARELYEQYRMKAANFQHNVIFVPLGGDFTWYRQSEWTRYYQSYSQLMDYMNSKPEWNISVKFGTLQEYFDLVNPLKHPAKNTDNHLVPAKPSNYPTLSGDFYVYSEFRDQYWSGYFTSRPFDKFLGREVQAALKAADILHVLESLYSKANYREEYLKSSESYKLLEISRRDLGVYQHHDAITGTAKPHVVKDYETRLTTAFHSLRLVIEKAMATLLHLGKNSTHENNSTHGNTKPGISSKRVPEAIDLFKRSFKFKLESQGTRLTVFNPLPRERKEVLTVTVDSSHVKISRADTPNIVVSHQVSPVWQDGNIIVEDSFEVSFVVSVPPLGIVAYIISTEDYYQEEYSDVYLSTFKKSTNPPQEFPFEMHPMGRFKRYTLENSCLRVTFPGANGMPTEIYDKVAKTKLRIVMEYISYKPAGSGAYLFRPDGGPVKRLTFEYVTVSYVTGPLFSSVRVTHPLFRATIKLFNTTRKDPTCWAISIDNIVTLGGSGDNEIAMRFNTNVNNRDILYTDGNGLNMVKHRRYKELPLEAGYYPMTTMAVIQDNRRRLTVHAAQPLGAASLKEGFLEIMLDRTFMSDDGKGLGEGITNNRPAPSRFFLTIESGVGEKNPPVDYFYPTLLSTQVNDFLQTPLVIATLRADDTNEMTSFTPMSTSMPCDGHMVSLRSLQIDPKHRHTTALIIHKRGYECGTWCGHLNCVLDWSRLTFSSLFKELEPSKVREMTLSYMDIKDILIPEDTVSLDTMDIKSYYIWWD